jgi:hypothetical protein
MMSRRALASMRWTQRCGIPWRRRQDIKELTGELRTELANLKVDVLRHEARS